MYAKGLTTSPITDIGIDVPTYTCVFKVESSQALSSELNHLYSIYYRVNISLFLLSAFTQEWRAYNVYSSQTVGRYREN